MKLTYEEVRNILPHRYPFIMVDKILNLRREIKLLELRMLAETNLSFRDTSLVRL